MDEKTGKLKVTAPAIAGTNRVGLPPEGSHIAEEDRCPECDGSGYGPAHSLTPPLCPACNGSGYKPGRKPLLVTMPDQKSKPRGYKEQNHNLNVVAIKKGQSEVHAPGHDTWGTVKCNLCSDEFLLGPNRIYGTSGEASDYAKRLETILAGQHKLNQPHRNSYDLGA